MSYAIRMCDLASITLQAVNLIHCTFRTGTGNNLKNDIILWGFRSTATRI